MILGPVRRNLGCLSYAQDLYASPVASSDERFGFRVGAPSGLERNEAWDAAKLRKALVVTRENLVPSPAEIIRHGRDAR